MSDDAEHHEVLIIKRGGGGHHDEHHGGVWKIAFADFMTAMMAFFLVMWLISANDKTKATIAKYFNPIELVDSTPQPTGLNDTKKDDPNVQRKSEKPAPEAQGKDAKPSEKSAPAPESAQPKPVDESPLDDADQSARHSEIEVIRDPYAVIAEIAAKKQVDPPQQAVPSTGHQPTSGTGAVGFKGGEAFRDPFEPQPIGAGPNSIASAAPVPDAPPAEPPPPAHEGAVPKLADASAAPVASAALGPSAAAAAPAAATSPAPAATPPAVAHPATPSTGAGKPDPTMARAEPGSEAARAEAARPADKPLSAPALQARIAALAKADDRGQAGPTDGKGDGKGETRSAGAGAPKVEVRETSEGTLISLTDTADFSMFASASARPSARSVALLGTIGKLLKAQRGSIIIRGYTDSRPFRSDTYDNWRLSTERAHLAQYMLTRGGLDDARIDAVEGFADRHPKNTKDPEAAENRRIEILIRNPAP